MMWPSDAGLMPAPPSATVNPLGPASPAPPHQTSDVWLSIRHRMNMSSKIWSRCGDQARTASWGRDTCRWSGVWSPYDPDVTSAHAYERPPDSSAPVEAVDAAEHGAVVYLVRGGRQIAAIVPPVVAAVGAAAVKALADIRAT